MAGQTLAQRLAAGKGLAPRHDGHIAWSRLADGKEFIASFDQVEALIDTLMQGSPGVTLPLSLTDAMYVVQAGTLSVCQVQDILNVNLTTTAFSAQNHTAVLADARGTILESTNNAFVQHIILPEDTGDPAVDFPLNATIEAVQVSPQQLDFTLANSGTMTFLAAAGTKARDQGSTICARRRAANTWHITGDTTT